MFEFSVYRGKQPMRHRLIQSLGLEMFQKVLILHPPTLGRWWTLNWTIPFKTLIHNNRDPRGQKGQPRVSTKPLNRHLLLRQLCFKRRPKTHLFMKPALDSELELRKIFQAVVEVKTCQMGNDSMIQGNLALADHDQALVPWRIWHNFATFLH